MRSTLISRIAVAMGFAALACSDSTGPKTIDPPTGVTVTMEAPTSAKITWTASPQSDLVTSYNVFRNGTKVGEVTATSYVDAGLSELIQYKYQVSANGKDGQVSALSTETSSSVITIPDVTAPRVTATSPAASAVNVARSSKISVTFSEAMKASTITTATISAKAGDGSSIAGTVSYDAATHVAELSPAASLPNASAVTVTVGTGVTDQAGNALVSPFTFSFTVRDEIAPTVQSVAPANQATGVSANTAVSVVFSESMDASTISTTTFTLRSTSSGALVNGAVSYDAASKSATFTPSSRLTDGTSYTVSLSTGAKDAAGNSLGAAFTSTFTTASAGDVTPPAIVGVTPANGATGVAVGTAVAITFSEPMSAASVTSSTLYLSGPGGNVSAAIALDATGTIATLTPSAALQNGATYTVTATTGLKDVAGNSLASTFTSGFTTVATVPVDNTPPTVVSSTPANGATNVAVTTTVSVTFSEDMNASTVNGSTLGLTVNGAQVAGTVSYDAGTRTATFNPSAGLLANGQSYVGTVTTGVKDVAGNPMAASFSFSFTTVQAVDNTPPSIVSRNPSPGATGVATNTSITVGFSEAMDASTINTSTFTLGNGGSSVAGTVSYDTGTRIATFTPASPLANAQTYTVTVTTGVRDVAGNAIASNDVYSFTTAGAAQVSITGMTNPTDGWWQATTAGSVGIHFHVVFAQSGSSLSLGPECPGGLNDRCITLAQNQAGADAIGPESPGYVWVLLTSVTGSYTGSQISFTMTNANGKTFTFTGTVNSSTSMSGTISGATLPAEQVNFTRPAP